MTDTYSGLISWSQGLEHWQRDALRRLATKETLLATDFDELVELSLGTSGVDAEPLDAEHLPVRDDAAAPVRLVALEHIQGVNRLQPGARLNFGADGLTVIFGLNGTGKSGYVRALKQCCSSRHPEEILPDVSSAVQEPPKVRVSYSVGDVDSAVDIDLRDSPGNLDLKRVPVYDQHSGRTHLARAGASLEVVPAGVDLLRRYVAFLDEFKQKLTLLAESVGSPETAQLCASFTDSEVAAAIDALGSPGALQRVESLAELTPEEAGEIQTLPQQIEGARSGSRASRLQLNRAANADAIRITRSLTAVLPSLTDDSIHRIETFESSREVLADLIEHGQEHDWTTEPLPGVGTPAWHELWLSAEKFATEHDPDGEAFPANLQKCSLCQQDLSAEAKERLERFASFAANDLARRLEELTNANVTTVERLRRLVLDDLDTSALAALNQVDADLVGRLTGFRARVEAIVDGSGSVLPAEPDGGSVDTSAPVLGDSPGDNPQGLSDLATELIAGLKGAAGAAEQRASAAQHGSPEDEILNNLLTRHTHLNERQVLLEQIGVLRQHDQDQTARATLLAIAAKCTTNAASARARQLSDATTKELVEAFARNLDPLITQRNPVQMQPRGVQKGSSRVGFNLGTGEQLDLSGVLSEGEFRSVALAAFLADLEVAGDQSALVFDDPVTSLDHSFQERVAERLVQEALQRQVIVFTHSTQFLGILIEAHEAAESQVGSPIAFELTEIEWNGYPGSVSRRPTTRLPRLDKVLHHIEQDLIPEATRAFDENRDADYQMQAGWILLGLRQAWEQAVEEVAVAGVVKRYRNSVQTQHLRTLTVLTDADCIEVDRGMTLESRYLHNPADGSARPPLPPTTLRAEVQRIRDWKTDLKRRQKAV